MSRRKNQSERRAQIVAAAQRAIVKLGLSSVRLRDVADEAGLTSGAVLYYFSELDALLVEVHHQAKERFCRLREEAVDAVDDPWEKLVVALRGGLPSGPDDELVRALYEFEGTAFRDSKFAALTRLYFERQVGIYHSIIVAGQAVGAFDTAAPARTVARNIVALEDGYGFYVVLDEYDIDAGTAEELILSYVRTALSAP
ncbi:TetR family transcriptional regulator C-terminal domain-containing protein [Jatrophihabitans telluris]|uniref:TetR family transcriptional regulator C-terminal domain-containing protein n=1 Tax=Jatrophihabitans telluris TaxID=2038343 RepID=A0ABY4QWH0_9ACTN|nr:TetR family transcriptional regulator C-terminal domain-containing protein [Jatrophihabitans telluris]UQX87432.1 TetR family transcriptional regulator C-terminal domain-containing protein [Jatrophihabitans telluris]